MRKPRAPLLSLLLLAATCAHAVAVYRHQAGDGGTVEFSDKPRVGADKLDIRVPLRKSPPPSAAPAPGTEQAAPSAADVQPQPYQALEISTPRNDDTVRDNAGNVGVELRLIPPLQPQFGHSLVLLMDGRPAEAPGLNTRFELRNVERGSHTLQAFVLDAVGKTLFASAKSTFHLHRASVRQTPPAP